MKAKNNKTKIIQKASKRQNEVLSVDRTSMPKTVKVRMAKSEISDGGLRWMGLGITLALRELGIDSLDITLTENSDCIEITLEK